MFVVLCDSDEKDLEGIGVASTNYLDFIDHLSEDDVFDNLGSSESEISLREARLALLDELLNGNRISVSDYFYWMVNWEVAEVVNGSSVNLYDCAEEGVVVHGKYLVNETNYDDGSTFTYQYNDLPSAKQHFDVLRKEGERPRVSMYVQVDGKVEEV